jgi:glutathione S-transferase
LNAGAARLYQFADSPFCAKIRKILDYKGIEYEVVEDFLDRSALLAASGQVRVPALTLPDDETIVDSERIALRLEERYPLPAIFPAGWRGLHLGLARYFDTQLEDTLFRLAVPDSLSYYRNQGAAQEALWRLIREGKYGEQFCDEMVLAEAANRERAVGVLAPLDQDLGDRPFLLNRLGYADFALYGQLTYLTFTGENKLPSELVNLREYYDRIDRISSKLDA